MTNTYIEQESYQTSTITTPNGHEVQDNRYHVVVDAKQVEAWEIEILESGFMTHNMILLARYLHKGDRPVSPGLPHKPLDEMTEEEMSSTKTSEAYKVLRRMHISKIKTASQSFMDQASAGF